MNTDKLEIILEKVKTLKEDQFNFENWVTEYDKEKGCGTVCCIVGWMPQWFPNCGINYTLDEDGLDLTIDNDLCDFDDLMKHMSNLLEVPYNIVEYLLAGKSRPFESLPKLGIHSSLPEVIDAWEETIEWLKKKTFKQYSLS